MSTERSAVELVKEKRFLGQEFLTWLWYRSDSLGDTVRLPDGREAHVSFERFMTLEGGEGDALESVTCRGLQAKLHEAKTALQAGKKVSRAHLRLVIGEFQWKFTFDAATFDISSLKVPGTVAPGEEEGDDLSFEGRVLERAWMIEQAVEAMEAMFREFLLARICPDKWGEEKRAIRAWIFRG